MLVYRRSIPKKVKYSTRLLDEDSICVDERNEEVMIQI